MKAVVVAILFVLSSASAATPPRTSGDGVPYPEAQGPDLHLPPAPVIGSVLGRLPEEAFTAKVFNADHSPAAVDRLLDDKSALGRDSALRCQWYTTAPYADAVGFDLTDGRVSRILLIFKPPMPRRTIDAFFDGFGLFRDISGRFRSNSDRIGRIRLDVAFYPDGRSWDKEDIRGGVMLITFNPAELYLASHAVKPEVTEALKHGKVIVGMTEQEARLAIYASFHALDAPTEYQSAWGGFFVKAQLFNEGPVTLLNHYSVFEGELIRFTREKVQIAYPDIYYQSIVVNGVVSQVQEVHEVESVDSPPVGLPGRVVTGMTEHDLRLAIAGTALQVKEDDIGTKLKVLNFYSMTKDDKTPYARPTLQWQLIIADGILRHVTEYRETKDGLKGVYRRFK